MDHEEMVCYVCDEKIKHQTVLTCSLHILCGFCFLNYLKHCCGEYATKKHAFPLQCSLKQCKSIISDAEIQRITHAEDLQPLGLKMWELYLEIQVKAALNDPICKDEIPVVCHCCGYTEILVAAPQRYWEQLKRIQKNGKIIAERLGDEFKRAKLNDLNEEYRKKFELIYQEFQAEKEDIEERFKQVSDVIQIDFEEVKRKIMERQADVIKEMEDYSIKEAELWNVITELFYLHWGEPLESKSWSNEQVQFIFQDFKMEDADFELLFDEIPQAQESDSYIVKDEIKRKKIRQLTVKADLIKQELNIAAPKLDHVFLEREEKLAEEIQKAENFKNEQLVEPIRKKNEEIKKLESKKSEMENRIKSEEKLKVKEIEHEAGSITAKYVKFLESDLIKVKLRDRLSIKVLNLDRQKSEEEAKDFASKDLNFSKLFSFFKKKDSEKPVSPERKDTEDIDVLDFLQEDEDIKRDPLGISINSTSQFFICAQVSCEGALCVRCQARIKKSEVESHLCKEDVLQEIYSKLVDILAESSTIKCPGCGFVWRKDLACTHMNCDKCHLEFCYHCGKSKSEVGGDFGPHNLWTLSTPESEGKCPMYLHFKYGDISASADRMDGDPQKALDRFHLQKQKSAVEKFSKSIDPELFDQVLKSKFPFGIWDEHRPSGT